MGERLGWLECPREFGEHALPVSIGLRVVMGLHNICYSQILNAQTNACGLWTEKDYIEGGSEVRTIKSFSL